MPWIDAIAADEIDLDDVVRWDHAGKTFALYRSEEDTYHATDGLCTHEQVHLADGLLLGFQIECPKHNGRFDIRDGSARRSPACDALRTYAVKIESGRLVVDIPD